ncbi:hypothetical protein [Massilia suwonensis]|uniref:DUF3224 domain-containing protein n=1 Tax=Massilia suwonensis TaxID=648895 RepID=A0ABW0MM13_9BURK
MFTSFLRTIARPAAVTLLLAASATASAGGWVVKPIQIEGTLVEAVGPADRCLSKFGGTISGHGDSALMGGKVVFIATDCITPVGPLFNFSGGKFIVMTTSGDQIYANYSGQFVPTGEGTKYVFSGATFQVTGGTGKFARITGGGSLSGGEDMATGTGNIKLNGTVLYLQN